MFEKLLNLKDPEVQSAISDIVKNSIPKPKRYKLYFGSNLMFYSNHPDIMRLAITIILNQGRTALHIDQLRLEINGKICDVSNFYFEGVEPQ